MGRIKDFLWEERRRLLRAWSHYRNETSLSGYAERGHFYSPLPGVSEAADYAAQFADQPATDQYQGVDLAVENQQALLERMVEFYSQFDWTEDQQEGRRFYLGQGYFKHADSLALYTVMRAYEPARVIEVGSGYSSALLLDLNDRYHTGKIHFTFIEPYPERLYSILRPNDAKIAAIEPRRVQEVRESVFRELQASDILFIDSSHVSKAGSDLNYLLFNVLPVLKPGVLVHFHDIYWPFEYPADWFREGHAWNESYLIRAFLLFNTAYEILFWTSFAAKRWPKLIGEQLPLFLKNTGGSLWIKRRR